MKFEHTIVVDAPVSNVIALFEDVPAVARCMPGVEEAVAVDPDVYEGRIRVRLGPLGFSLAGRANLDRGEDGMWRLQGEGRDARVGAGVQATLEARLEELAPRQTEVAITADVRFSGRLAGLGQPLIRRRADSMVREFAENLRSKFA